MPPKIYVPFLNIGSVPSAKAQKKPKNIWLFQIYAVPLQSINNCRT